MHFKQKRRLNLVGFCSDVQKIEIFVLGEVFCIQSFFGNRSTNFKQNIFIPH